MSAYVSTTKVISEIEHWIRLATFLHEPLKASLLELFHNPQYGGLPRDPVILYKELDSLHKQEIEKKKKKKIISKEQYDKIFPLCQQTNSEKLDVTLLVFLIKQCIPSLPKHILRAVESARAWRNFVHHTEPSTIDLQKFNAKWNEGCFIIKQLLFKYDTQTLKSMSLDPKQTVVLNSIELFLQQILAKQHCQDKSTSSQISAIQTDLTNIKLQQDALKLKQAEIEENQISRADKHEHLCAKLDSLENDGEQLKRNHVQLAADQENLALKYFTFENQYHLDLQALKDEILTIKKDIKSNKGYHQVNKGIETICETINEY